MAASRTACPDSSVPRTDRVARGLDKTKIIEQRATQDDDDDDDDGVSCIRLTFMYSPCCKTNTSALSATSISQSVY